MANIAIVIENVFGLDGRYEIDASAFTNRELHTIKQISGLRAGELGEAIDAGDSDLIVALASIALTRHGKNIPVDVLWDAEAGRIALEPIVADDDPEEAALPPTNGGADTSDAAANTTRSGPTSNGSGESPANDRSPTGYPRSETDATSPPPILAT